MIKYKKLIWVIITILEAEFKNNIKNFYCLYSQSGVKVQQTALFPLN